MVNDIPWIRMEKKSQLNSLTSSSSIAQHDNDWHLILLSEISRTFYTYLDLDNNKSFYQQQIFIFILYLLQ